MYTNQQWNAVKILFLYKINMMRVSSIDKLEICRLLQFLFIITKLEKQISKCPCKPIRWHNTWLLLDVYGWIKKKTTLYSSQIVFNLFSMCTVYTTFNNNTNKDGSRWIECPHKFNIILQWSVIIFISHLCLSFLCISLYYWIYIDFVICYRLLSLFILTVPQMYCAINYIAWT